MNNLFESYKELFQEIEPHYSNSICVKLKELFETKHLYQSITISYPDDIVKEVFAQYSSGGEISPNYSVVNYFKEYLPVVNWSVPQNEGRRTIPGIGGTEFVPEIDITPPTVKLFCKNCKRTEAYNYLYGEDILKNFYWMDLSEDLTGRQIFYLAYQCQACKFSPEIFTIDRRCNKVTITGRTPIEQVEVPENIPTKFRYYFSDAIVAYNSGQVLAANFLLRTFIEQFVRKRSVNPENRDVDALFSEYKNSLPKDFNTRFPSLKAIYDELSTDMHGAVGSDVVFTESNNKILVHFDGVNLFKKTDKLK